MSPLWMRGPWLSPELYSQQLLARVADDAASDGLTARVEFGAAGTRLCVWSAGQSESVGRRDLLELLTAATRAVIEQDLDR